MTLNSFIITQDAIGPESRSEICFAMRDYFKSLKYEVSTFTAASSSSNVTLTLTDLKIKETNPTGVYECKYSNIYVSNDSTICYRTFKTKKI